MAARSPARSIAGPDRHAHLVSQDVRQRRLAQTGGTIEEDVFQRFAASLGGLDQDGEVLPDPFLPDQIPEIGRPKRVVGVVVAVPIGGYHAVIRLGHSTDYTGNSIARTAEAVPRRKGIADRYPRAPIAPARGSCTCPPLASRPFGQVLRNESVREKNRFLFPLRPRAPSTLPVWAS